MKRAFVIGALSALLGVLAGVALVSVVSCAPKLPPSYSIQAQRASNAHELLQEVTALSQTAINLNALSGGSPGRLSDDDTRAVRDFALSIADATAPYVNTGLSSGITTAFASFNERLSANAKASPQLKAAFSIVQATIAAIAAVR